MVRMSDLVRGIPTQPAHAPAPPPPTRLAAGLRESATAPPLRREPKPAPTLDAPALPPPAIEGPAESAEALYGEIQQFVAGGGGLLEDRGNAVSLGGPAGALPRAGAPLARAGGAFLCAPKPAR